MWLAPCEGALSDLKQRRCVAVCVACAMNDERLTSGEGSEDVSDPRSDDDGSNASNDSSSSDSDSSSSDDDSGEEGYAPPDKEFIDIRVADLNPYLTCVLCNGYFRDAHTATECLHTCTCPTRLRVFCQTVRE